MANEVSEATVDSFSSGRALADSTLPDHNDVRANLESVPHIMTDEFILSARIYCRADVPPLEAMHRKATRTTRFDDGGIILSFGPRPERVDDRPERPDHSAVVLSFAPRRTSVDDRQEQFEAEWRELIELFQSFASLPEVLAQPGSFLELRLSLCPDEGQAGLVMVR